VIEKPLVSRAIADRDIDDAVDYYTDVAGVETALRFVSELAKTKRRVAEAPRHGSPRYAPTLGTPNLRHRKIGRFPYLVFYIEHDDWIDVVRVLHAARDIPSWLTEPEGGD
jgi:toxin ParE1/3/4